MAQGSNPIFLSGREVKYAGSPAWDAAFPNGVRWIQGTPVTVDGATGYIPPPSGPNTNPNNGGNPMIDPATGLPYPKSG
jgi:hypothetical protein